MKFKYKDKVVVTGGFYEGLEGELSSMSGNQYILKSGEQYVYVEGINLALANHKDTTPQATRPRLSQQDSQTRMEFD